ncbi:MAG: hypothetical protein KF712_03225 [Akkermansiaceae bacterium]|nr:hypothetical protein [Akkermansiaceae bacterium]
MNLQLLHQKLKTYSEGELAKLHDQLIGICTKGRLESHSEISRRLSIIETTDSARGSLIQPLLGKTGVLDTKWIPANSADRLYLNTVLYFESDPKASNPKFSVIPMGQSRKSITEEEALAHVRQASRSNLAHIHVVADFEKLPAGWTLVCHPQTAPGNGILDLVSSWDPATFWLLVCRDQSAGTQILAPFENHPKLPTPLLVHLSDPVGPPLPDAIPDFICHVPFVEAANEVIDRIQTLLERLRRIAKPGKEELIYSILQCHQNATEIQEQAKERKNQQTNHELALEQAATDWRLLFINERREAIRDIQLESVAHMMTKFKLLTRNAREARVAIYAQDQLYPRLRNLIGKFILNLRTTSRMQITNTGNHESPVAMWTNFENAAMTKSGILHALPSIGLLLPVSLVSVSEVQGRTQKLLTEPKEYGDSRGWLTGMRNKALEPISDRLDQTNEHLSDTNELMADLIDFLVTSTAGIAIGTAVAGAAASFVIAKGAIVLRQAEQMILDLIDETEQSWPLVEENLRALLFAVNDDLDDQIVRKANCVVQRLESI